MWFYMADKKLALPNPPNIMSFKIGMNFLAYAEFAVTWEIVKLQIELWLSAPPTLSPHLPTSSLCEMGNSKCVNRLMFSQITHTQICDP